MTGTRCTCGQGHETFGACMRAKNIKVGYCRSHVGWDTTREKKWDANLESYRQARRDGIQPESTRAHHVDLARRASDIAGEAYVAS